MCKETDNISKEEIELCREKLETEKDFKQDGYNEILTQFQRAKNQNKELNQSICIIGINVMPLLKGDI